MYTIHETVLWEIFTHLHPLALHGIKLVCRRWYRVIDNPKMTEWFFYSRYGTRSSHKTTYWDQYYPLPGAERYRCLNECRHNAVKLRNRKAIEYFFRLGPDPIDNIEEYISSHMIRELFFVDRFRRPNREEIEFVKSFVRPNIFLSDLQHYGTLIGQYGDIQLYEEELNRLKDPIFITGFIHGICFDGHPQFKELLDRFEIHKRCTDERFKNSVFTFNSYHDGVDLIRDYISEQQFCHAQLGFLKNEEIVQCIKDYLVPDNLKGTPEEEKIILDNLSELLYQTSDNSLTRYLSTNYPKILDGKHTFPRSLLNQAKKNWDFKLEIITDHENVRRNYIEIIELQDWDILDEFVDAFFFTKYFKPRRPKQRYLYSIVSELIRKNKIRHLAEILDRLDRLYVTDKPTFYRRCLYSAAYQGKKDLVEYFLPYVKLPIKFNIPKSLIRNQNLNRRFPKRANIPHAPDMYLYLREIQERTVK